MRLPNGTESTREDIVHPGAAVIPPIFDNGDLLLERQHRYPLRRDFLELPAGKLDPDENELTCAQRKLREETGYLARGLEFSGENMDEDKFLEILRVPFNEAKPVRGCSGSSASGSESVRTPSAN